MGNKKFRIGFEEIFGSFKHVRWEYLDTIDELKDKLRSAGAFSVNLVYDPTFMDNARGYRKEGNYFKVDELTEEHLEWLGKEFNYEIRLVSFFPRHIVN
jgi:hypothetical protein